MSYSKHGFPASWDFPDDKEEDEDFDLFEGWETRDPGEAVAGRLLLEDLEDLYREIEQDEAKAKAQSIRPGRMKEE